MTDPQQTNVNIQTAPYPHELADLVEHLSYRPGWAFGLETNERDPGCSGLTLAVMITTQDSYDHARTVRVRHLFPVPPATYNRASWCRWLLECLEKIERHECMEFFRIDGMPVFAPNHGPGWDPYIVTQLTTELDRHTNFRGEVQPPADAQAPLDACASGGRPRVPDHDADAPGPTVRHPFKSRLPEVAHYADHHDGLAGLRERR